MRLTLNEKNRCEALDRQSFGPMLNYMRFAEPEDLLAATHVRNGLLLELAELGVLSGARGTKLDVRHLSPGCRLCGEGRWSCLFVNNLCNGGCFYCPTSQQEVGMPSSGSLTFHHPQDFAEYLARFGFRGASISGGEPLLTPGRSLAFLRAARERLGRGVHLWLYTNGKRVNAAILERLRQAGLDEIRFDLGAVDYTLDSLRLAVGVIPTVTVEIPAIPGDEPRLTGLVEELATLGVHHLNLHQLRATPHNVRALIERDFTFLHGDPVTVLGSEICALRVMRHAVQNDLPVGINYCASSYKQQFQRAATRRRNAQLLRHAWEDITETGLLRRLELQGPPAVLTHLAEHLRQTKAEGWHLEDGRLYLRCELLATLELGSCGALLSYEEVTMRGQSSGVAESHEKTISPTCSVWLERQPHLGPLELSVAEVELFTTVFTGSCPPTWSDLIEGDFISAELLPGSEDGIRRWQRIYNAERIRSGLTEYF